MDRARLLKIAATWCDLDVTAAGSEEQRIMTPPSLLNRVWNYSFLVTAPLALLTLLWLLPSLQMIRSFGVVHTAPYADIVLDAPKILWSHVAALRERWRSADWIGSAPPPLPVYNLAISPDRLAQLETRLPDSGKDSVKANIQFPDGRIFDVKARFRGDNLNHWGFPVRSWRVRVRNSGFADGHRAFDFVLPRWRAALSYYLPLRMAHELGLMAPEPQFVFLAVNGRIRGGVHMLLDVVDESFLRQNGRMPGDIFVGDMVLSDGRLREERSGLTMWAVPDAWSKTAKNSNFAADSKAPLAELFLRIGLATDGEGLTRLKELLNLRQWARLAAWLQLSGASHFDVNHNWVLLFDAGRQRFEPIVRDGNALTDDVLTETENVPRRDVGISAPILAVLHHDHEFLRLKNEAIAAFFRDNKDLLLVAEANSVGSRLRAAFQQSRQLDWIDAEETGSSFHYLSPEQFADRLVRYTRVLHEWFALQRSALALHSDHVAVSRLDAHRLRVRIAGGGVISALRIPISADNGEPSACLSITLHNGIETCTPIDRFTNWRAGFLEITLPLLAQYRVHISDRVHSFADADIVPATYDIVLRGAEIVRGEAIQIEGSDSGRHAMKADTSIELIPFLDRTFGIVPIEPAPTIWSGEVRLTENIDIRGDLVITPGTRVRLGPSVNVVVHGRVLAEGTPEQPIAVARLDDSRPWGAFALIGPRASDSRFRHCTFDGGSGFKSAFTLFSGMFSVHDVDHFEISDCRFSKNAEYDDLLHFVYASGRLTNVVVENAVSDAIDIDIGVLSIDRLTVRKAGNDALDLMTSEITVNNSSLTGAGDKGISVGENSKVRVNETTIVYNNIGIEAKDGSQVYARKTSFSENGTHISGYHKNPRYVGVGVIVIEDSTIRRYTVSAFTLKDGTQAVIASSPLASRDLVPGVIVDPPQTSAAWDTLQAARHLLVKR